MVENLIVRIIGKDLDGTRTVGSSLRGIKGIGQRVGGIITNKFCEENKLDKNTKLGDLTAEQVKKLEDVVLHLENHGLPTWSLNRQLDYDTGRRSVTVRASSLR